ERLERRIGIDDAPSPAASREAHPASRPPAEPVDIRTARARATERREAPRAEEPAAEEPASPTPPPPPSTPPVPVGPVTLQQIRDAWPEVLAVVEKAKRTAWTRVRTTTVRAYVDDVLTLAFANETDVASFREAQGAGES